jgi:hypothetical membrane protein
MKKAARNNYKYLGAVLWVLSIQYYIAQLIVALSWHNHNQYSWANNTISDLANTHCGTYGSRLVCSPLHNVMNISFIVLGCTMIGGALILRRQLERNRLSSLGFGCMALAGVGTILVGLFPENTVSWLHVIGAALPFIFGNLGMLMIGGALEQPSLLRGYTIFSGLVGLAALACFITSTYLGLGIGGMERFVSYPQSIWMIVFGSYLLLSDSSKVNIVRPSP